MQWGKTVLIESWSVVSGRGVTAKVEGELCRVNGNVLLSWLFHEDGGDSVTAQTFPSDSLQKLVNFIAWQLHTNRVLKTFMSLSCQSILSMWFDLFYWFLPEVKAMLKFY